MSAPAVRARRLQEFSQLASLGRRPEAQCGITARQRHDARHAGILQRQPFAVGEHTLVWSPCDGAARQALFDSQPGARERILAWYSRKSAPLPAVGSTAKNIYGINDLHGVIWEWVHDTSALMVSGDSRNQGDPDTLQFCGAGALSANDRENYPVLMRIAMLSSLGAASTTRNLGFRCAKDGVPTKARRRIKP